jgi:hypothetical protein
VFGTVDENVAVYLLKDVLFRVVIISIDPDSEYRPFATYKFL